MAGKVERFEELKCWQKARELVAAVYNLCNQNTELARDFVTQKQLKAAALSTMNNIAEGFGRYSNKDFLKFLDYSSSSGMEVRSMLYALLDQKYISEKTFEEIYQLTVEHCNLTIGLIKYVSSKTNT
ncbi:MAG: four helix bundle protein [Bacteroidia bacterium]